MTGFLRRAALLAVLLGGCDGDGEEGVGPEGVREAVVPVEHALMVRSGELLD
ncbi:MAG: hypothetical protein FJ098_13800, partial [Deltaproteobacteria bacterium]|nr:hypothetical protein [Deltaproteobacteria bacterium]